MKYKFGDIAINSTTKKKPEENDKFHYIGLEHLDSGNLIVQRYGAVSAPVGEKLIMKRGDVLFGKRRAYQKKVAIAPFDGIFSAHGMVLRPNETVVTKEFFPFFISSDSFLNEAIRISVGSLSPTINWRDLKELTFDLPPLEEQERLAELLWAAYDLKESYKQLIAATDEMVKAKFMEMFKMTKKYIKKPLSEFIDISFSGEWGTDDFDGTGVKIIRTTNFTNEGSLNLSGVITRNIDEKKILKKKLQKGDIILERSGGTKDNPVGRVVLFNEDGTYLSNNFTQILRCKDEVRSLYIFYSLYNYYQTNKATIRSIGNQTTGIQNLKMDSYWNIPIEFPRIEEQERFETIYQQAEKSKRELRQAMAQIDKVIKSLLP